MSDKVKPALTPEEWGGYRLRMRSLADRISALLPPRETKPEP